MVSPNNSTKKEKLIGAWVFGVLLLLALVLPARADYQSGVSAYERGDYSTAFRELSPPARQGDPHAPYYLGIMYAQGQSAPRDDVARGLSLALIREARAMAEPDRAIAARPPLLDLRRSTRWETVVFFMGDVTILGLLAIAEWFSLLRLENIILFLYVSYGNWFAGGIAAAWWALTIRVMFVLRGERRRQRRYGREIGNARCHSEPWPR